MTSNDRNGFSTIEVVVTIVVGAIFIMSSVLLSIAIENSMSTTRYRALANDVSYKYLRKYVSVDQKPVWFSCSTATGASNTNDAIVNPNATGQTVENGTLTRNDTGLPEPITYEVKALAVYGCAGANAGTPILVTSSVTFGPNNNKIEQATYESY